MSTPGFYYISKVSKLIHFVLFCFIHSFTILDNDYPIGILELQQCLPDRTISDYKVNNVDSCYYILPTEEKKCVHSFNVPTMPIKAAKKGFPSLPLRIPLRQICFKQDNNNNNSIKTRMRS